MQFKVPQFLDIEDKIFGPFTFKQFVYLVGGAGLCYVFYQWLGFLLGLIPILAIASLSGALAFYRPNNKPFIDMIESGFKYMLQNKLYVWKRREVKKQTPAQVSASQNSVENRNQNTQRLGSSKLRDLAWSLDVLDLKK